MKKILLILTVLVSLNSWAKSFETESGRKYKEFSEGEFINQDKWFDGKNSPFIYMLDGHSEYGIITMCIYGVVHIRQINHGEFSTIYGSVGAPYFCEDFEKTIRPQLDKFYNNMK
ncbi:hypothetical protein OA103_00185 [Gammaproteobacteria bacterium]|nr:hypothetical protein [Gammaproteobacteria bacterium]